MSRRVWKAPRRDPTITDESIEVLCEALRRARPLTLACLLAKIDYTALCEKMAKEPELKLLIEEARGQGEDWMASKMERAIDEDRKTQGPAWWLERLSSDRWGKTERIEHSGPNGGPMKQLVSPVVVDVTTLTRIARGQEEPARLMPVNEDDDEDD